MFRRTIYKDLKEWKDSPRRKPLVLRGARQVGKTSAVNIFGESFDNYLYLNLENPLTRSIFEQKLTIDELMVLLFAHVEQTRKPGSTLVFLDEIQNSPEAIAKLRYFYEENPGIHVIAAGSLLENVIDVHKSFPVGRVQYMAMRPCSYKEFLWALGKDELSNILENPMLTIPLHEQFMKHFNTYTLIGGMPEVVADFAKNGDIIALEDIYESLLQGYRDDVEKYAVTRKNIDIIRFILNVGWLKAGETITLGNFAGSNFRAKDVAEGFRVMGKAMISELVYPTSSVMVPVIGETTRAPKLIWLDTGLVNYAAGVQKEILDAPDILDAWRGRVAEQVVAQELLTLTNKVSQTRAFWSRNSKESSAEVDFVLPWQSVLYPIEVKAGHNAHLKSLHSFMDRSDGNVAIRVWSQPLSFDKVQTASGKEFTLINLPFYLVGHLPEVIEIAGN